MSHLLRCLAYFRDPESSVIAYYVAFSVLCWTLAAYICFAPDERPQRESSGLMEARLAPLDAHAESGELGQ